MSDQQASALDALRINRTADHEAGFPLAAVIGAVLVTLLLCAVGIGAYAYWNSSSVVEVRAFRVAGAANADGALLDASGYVVPRRRATISARIGGRLAYMGVEEGDYVEEGEVVARLDDTNQRAALQESEARLEQARTAFENRKPTYERYVTLYAQNLISADEINSQKIAYDTARTALAVAEANLVSAQNSLNDTIVMSPFAGVVIATVAQIGEIVSVGAGGGSLRSGIATVVDMDSLEVQVDVSENYINRVRPGQDALVTLNAYPQWQIPAYVINIIPTADQARASVKVRIGMREKDGRVLPQMGTHVRFLTEEQASAPMQVGMIVPAEAVQTDDGETGIVFVIRGDVLEQRDVGLGERAGQTITILSGVASGERLAIGDFSELQNGLEVRIQE